MKQASRSRREELLPADIDAILISAHGAEEHSPLGSREALGQIEVGPVWHGMALDLMLGNLEHPVWGWADPLAIRLLEYWKSLDPSIAFVLVYDSPRTLLTREVEACADLSSTKLQERVDGWCNYNEELLRFYHRNADRALLVHAQQVERSVSRYVQQVRARIGAPLHVPAALDDDGARSLMFALTTGDGRHELSHSLQVVPGSNATPPEALSEFLAETAIRGFPRANELYDELQSMASLPLVATESVGVDVLGAWRALVKVQAEAHEHCKTLDCLRYELDKSLEYNRQYSQRIEALTAVEQLAASRLGELERAREELSEQRELLKATTKELDRVKLERDRRLRVEEEYSALTAKLHDTQDELEQRVMELERQSTVIDGLQNALQKANSQSQMQSSRLEARSQDLLRQNEALLAQLHRTQEDLERNYLEYQALKAASKNPSKPKKQTYFGAGERIKRQLTYRLGATMIQHSRSIGGWISMPWALVRETQRFRAERLAMASTKLPKLSEYSDAKDAERVRRHLSYRLGQVLLDHIRSPIRWPRLPFAIRTEVRAFRTEKAAQ
ncbi:hypothetical protein [Cupriavidus gilardii]|jgi:hypothetical protein|uniref:hypothetical protein n=1 Tax=Cupriavidus gilardii TaxID=82541 RepID=UPI001580F70C|nr:hypothetical protein [Cupriavidus gilardii]QKS64252.1 hypothetical protein FOB47_20825 [Cupriavidus gilardii]